MKPISLHHYRQTIAGIFFFILFSQITWPVLASRNVVAIKKNVNFNPVLASKKFSAPIQRRVSNFNATLSGLHNNDFAESENAKTFSKPEIDNSSFNELHLQESGPGPAQPEMLSFQSVNNNKMVDLFTGDFSYNIPLLDVGGYPVNLHYSSGITMDQEASWVGLGWNINPGTISRSIRGLPDDFGGEDIVEKTLSIKANKTLGISLSGDVEVLGFDKIGKSKADSSGISVGGSLGVFHNTYKGWGTEFSVNAGVNAGLSGTGSLSAGLGITNNSQDGLDYIPSFGIKLDKLSKSGIGGDISVGTNYNARTGIQGLQMTTQIGLTKTYLHNKEIEKRHIGSGIPSFISFAKQSYTPSISIPFTSSQFSFTSKIGGEAWVVHPNLYIKGYSSTQFIALEDMKQSIPAYGYLYFQDAEDNEHVLLDFNRDKDVPFREKTPHIAVPSYTYDTYSISGEGTGGMFRPYRGDVGYVFDHSSATKASSSNFQIDLGFGQVFHAGVDFNGSYTSTKTNLWTEDNPLKKQIRFGKRDTTFEQVYFKNPGEKTRVNSDFYSNIGDDDLVKAGLVPFSSRAVLSQNLDRYKNAKLIGKNNISSNLHRNKRDTRNQVITFLTAKDAKQVALDTAIRSYPINVFPNVDCNTPVTLLPRIDQNKKAKHISEITVLNDDGRRYVYGTPVYNITQQDVTFATGAGDAATGLVNYSGTDNSVNNSKGQDHYYSKEELPPYAPSYLLTGILSADYSDVKGDGITEDDQGDAIKFNYSEVYTSSNPYRWRAPYFENQASYSEGFKTDSRDEKGSYSYGAKEIWYLNSIESKTMMATFVLETNVDSARRDVYGVKGENGGAEPDQKLYRLKEINLYSKADVSKNGITIAKPIKTVHFDYDYTLCPGTPSSASGSAKLTLKRVWFSYNKNEKGRLNPFEFTYHTNNPSYNNKSYDRWGNYKDPAGNPGGLTNMDFPYTRQSNGNNFATDSTNASAAVAAWTMTNIKLPSGGKIKVSYESDEYAYVQDKRAMQMFDIAGLGNASTATPEPNLYTTLGFNNWEDNYYIFINVPKAITATDPAQIQKEIFNKYLDGISKLYFKFSVNMPGDTWGSGSEFVPCYADIDDFGMKGNNSDKKIWIKVKPIDGKSPMVMSAMQFLRLNLPSKAYPVSEPGDDVSFREIMGTLKTVASNVAQTKKGFIGFAKSKDWCKDVVNDKSFVRLNNPDLRKFGGGLRVKKIEISDNWNSMTGKAESVYGQEYDYTTTTEINGMQTVISSGVASYEPGIGKDENPFTVAIDYYKENIAALAPTNYFYTEEPLAESYYPSAFVGYSKVRVQTIHKDKKSANGLDETEFYTTKDFPTKAEYTSLADGKITYNPKIPNFFKFDAKHFVTLSQGFKVELNDMNGKVKKQASYAQNDLINPFSYTINYYKLDDDNLRSGLSNKVAVIDSANGVVANDVEIGKDIDMLVDLREQTTKTFSPSVQANIEVAQFFPPLIFGSLIPKASFETNRYRSAAVMKVVNRYGILDSVIHVEKGSKVSTKNMVYDGKTGNVLLSRTNNEFDDPVYNFSYPAHWAYNEIGHAVDNIGAAFKGLTFKFGKLYKGSIPFASENYFQSGDELLVQTDEEIASIIYPGAGCDPVFQMKPAYLARTTNVRLWAIAAQKGKEHEQGMYFIDRYGKYVNLVNCDVTIIRSGKRNITSASAGSVTMLDNPLKTVNNVQRIVIDSLAKVIAANAGSYKEFWKTDSSLYLKDSCYTFIKYDSITLIANNSVLFRKVYKWGKGKTWSPVQNDSKILDQNLTAGLTRDEFRGGKSWDLLNTSILNFDFTGLKGITVTSAKLSLGGKPYYDVVANPKGHLGNISNAYAHNLNGFDNDEVSRGNNFYLEKITTNWQGISNLNMDKIGVSHVNKISVGTKLDATCDNLSNWECGTLIQDIINSQFNNGIMLTVPAVVLGGDNSHTAKRSQSYYSGFNYNPSSSDLCKSSTLDHFGNPIPPIQPTLKIYFTSIKDTCISECRPNIDSSAVNPYVWGILGNWRMDRSLTYYGQRKEADPDPSYATNTRTDEQIAGFVPYWAFNNDLLIPSADTMRWVWNSEITQYNRKGMEIENRDPLNRYNSGQYGYNQSLPVAVTQNSRVRNAAFDGFEDYDYVTDNCLSVCPTARFVDFVAAGGTRDAVQRHSGKYSLKLSNNQTTSTTIPVVSVLEDSLPPYLSITTDSVINSISKNVIGKGSGLLTKYGVFSKSATCGGGPFATEYSNVDKNWGTGHPSQICTNDKFTVSWSGFIQPRYTDYYTFTSRSDDGFQLVINGTLLIDSWFDQPAETDRKSNTIYLEQGKLYNISVIYYENLGKASAQLWWQSNSQQKEIIPLSQLYKPNMIAADSAGSVLTTVTYCVKLHSPQPFNTTIKKFSPIAGTKMLVSAWVKEGAPCTSGSYSSSSIDISFTGSSETFQFKPSGNIIEGWQRMEDTLSVPATATAMIIKLRSLGSVDVNFDDIRLHPFNALMKSYVYDPESLRLMAELDENNFASYYEYDDDGTLTRIKKETERGIKTIQETRSALLKDQ